MKYKAVIFDLYGTLTTAATRLEYDGILRNVALELSLPPDDFVELWHASFNRPMAGFLQTHIDCVEYIYQQLGEQKPDGLVDLASRIRFDMTKMEIAKPSNDAIKTISYLKSRGYKTGLISNCSSDIPALWNDTLFAPLIDKPIFSCSVGFRKPDPDIYLLASKGLGITPNDCVFIDNTIENLDGASQVGMYTVLLRVPAEEGNNPYRLNAEEWDGHAISSLKEVLDILK